MAEFTTAIEDTSPIMQGTEADRAADYANYFCSYSYLYHQKTMLMDTVRMNAYHSAIMHNRSLFEGKVVLDVGTGSGVLSIWSAQAGAKKVFAVEYTDMAKHARNLVEKNGLSGIVEVIQSSAEDLQLPCKVDIIISEWMGNVLLRESMLDSVIRARNKWLKPDGCLFPSHATMYFSAISYEDERLANSYEYTRNMEEWNHFSHDMRNYYNIDMSALAEPFGQEMLSHYVYSAVWTGITNDHIVGEPIVMKRLDLNKCTIKDVECVSPCEFNIFVPFQSKISGFAAWFTVDFNGSVDKPVTRRVTLSTGPEVPYTHWGKPAFYLREALDCVAESRISGVVSMLRQDVNKRLYDLFLEFKTSGQDENVTKLRYRIP